MFDYQKSIRDVLLLTDVFYATVIDDSHNWHRINLNFSEFLALLCDRENRYSLIRHIKGMQVISLTLGNLPTSLSDDALSAIYTTVLHTLGCHTNNLLPFVVVKWSSRDDIIGRTFYSKAVERILPRFPELTSLMLLTEKIGCLELDVIDEEVSECYFDAISDICYVPMVTK